MRCLVSPEEPPRVLLGAAPSCLRIGSESPVPPLCSYGRQHLARRIGAGSACRGAASQHTKTLVRTGPGGGLQLIFSGSGTPHSAHQHWPPWSRVSASSCWIHSTGLTGAMSPSESFETICRIHSRRNWTRRHLPGPHALLGLPLGITRSRLPSGLLRIHLPRQRTSGYMTSLRWLIHLLGSMPSTMASITL